MKFTFSREKELLGGEDDTGHKHKPLASDEKATLFFDDITAFGEPPETHGHESLFIVVFFEILNAESSR
jgi:hypothetical protein